MSSIDYSEKIPNNVNLAEDRTLKRALEQWSKQECKAGKLCQVENLFEPGT